MSYDSRERELVVPTSGGQGGAEHRGKKNDKSSQNEDIVNRDTRKRNLYYDVKCHKR